MPSYATVAQWLAGWVDVIVSIPTGPARTFLAPSRPAAFTSPLRTVTFGVPARVVLFTADPNAERQ